MHHRVGRHHDRGVDQHHDRGNRSEGNDTMTTPAPQVRTARHDGTCGNRACLSPIHAGAQIVKSPAGSWVHADCARPGKRSKAGRLASILAVRAVRARR
jgi:hypothetical protein